MIQRLLRLSAGAPRHAWVGWGLIALPAATDLVLLAGSGMSLYWPVELPVLTGLMVLGLLWWLYSAMRKEPHLAELARVNLMFVLYTNVAAVLSYLLTGLSSLQLLDHQLSAIDRILGFDWLETYRWWKNSPWWLGGHLVYMSLGPELVLLLLLLSPAGQPRRARELYLAFAISSLVAITLGALLPAAGAYVEYQVPEARTTAYVQQYLGLRDGTIRLIDLHQVQGIVQFPSFHAALAVLCSYVLRGMQRAFALSLIWNGLIVMVTPVFGGHFLVDVIGGLVLAAATMACLNWLAEPNADPRSSA